MDAGALCAEDRAGTEGERRPLPKAALIQPGECTSRILEATEAAGASVECALARCSLASGLRIPSDWEARLDLPALASYTGCLEVSITTSAESTDAASVVSASSGEPASFSA